MKYRISAIILLVIFAATIYPVTACTNFIITKKASKDGSVMITYAADSHTRYGAIAYYPAAEHVPGSPCEVYHYENGKLLGTIPEVAHTFSVVQFMNEKQVAIGETTFGGLDSLATQPGAILDYGSLMRIGLQRSKTAREMIRIMTELVKEYGYATSGESFSISDPNEAWIMELIGKGKYEKGAVWVARLVPDGYVSGHANQARITTFPFQKSNNWNNPGQTVYHSPDVISFAKKHGFYKGEDATFSFSEVYNPLKFGGARFCDARVWSFFRNVSREIRENPVFTAYAQGEFIRESKFSDQSPNPNAYATNRLPLWVKPDSPVLLRDVMARMRDHYEDTPLDMRNDNGAGPYKSPYRWRPMEFAVDSVMYLNERAVATQQTGYSFVAQSRSGLPDAVGGVFWFGTDDADGCVYAPMFCGISRIPQSFALGNGSMISWSETSAYWTFSQVNNWAYSRYNVIHPEIEKYQSQLESQFVAEVEDVQQKVKELANSNPGKGIEYLTDYSVRTGDKLVADWSAFYRYLFMKYHDGNIKVTDGNQLKDNGNKKNVPVKPLQPGYGRDWERIMIQGTGERLKVPKGEQ
jgi:dipeptidase